MYGAARWSLALLSSLVLVGCLTEGAGDDSPRGPLGKADATGSCRADDGGDFCGAQSAGNCWCDDLCESYGDCCEDKVPVCSGDDGAEREVEVIFTAPFCDVCSSADKTVLLARSPIIARVVELLDGADATVDIAQFTFSRREIEDAILRARDRGVAVRVAMDAGQDRDGSLSRRLRDAGVDVRSTAGNDNGSYAGLQHAKFMIVDADTLLTGSNNWSSTGTSINEENTIVVTATPSDPQIAGFSCHFEAIWARDPGAAGACSSDGLAFAPSSAGKNLIRDSIRASQVSVDVLMHHLTFGDLVKELARAAERGVRVRVIVNAADRAEHTGSNWTRLINAGGQLRYKQDNEAAYQLMHHKLTIIDGAVLINGSGNWSGSAFFNNFENFVRYSEPHVVGAFVELYDRLWLWSLSGASLDSGVDAAEQHAAETSAFYGNLHAHFDASDGVRLLDDGKPYRLDDDGNQVPVATGSTVTESARLAFEYGRDMAGLDFLALTPHCSDDRAEDSPTMPNMSADGFLGLRGAADQVTAASGGAFIALAGMEWSTNSVGNHVNILGSSELAKVERGRFDTLYGEFLPARAAAGDRPIAMFNHPRTMRTHEESLDGNWDQVYGVSLADVPKSGQRKVKFNDFGLDDYAPLRDVREAWIAGDAMPDAAVVDATLAEIAAASAPYVRLMEVTLGRGTEFGSESASNPSLTETEEGGLERRTKVHSDWDYYLLRGFRMAPAASHDNHWANWGTGHTSRTGVIAPALTVAALNTALHRRQVFASEDENLELRLYVDGRVPMGSVMATTAATATARIELIDPDYAGGYDLRIYGARVGDDEVRVLTTAQVEGDGWATLTVPLGNGEQFFYVEVVETGADRMAWSAPIWIDRL